MANRYLACIDCVYNKGELSFPNGVYPCGHTACIKPNNDIPAITHIIDNKSIGKTPQEKLEELNKHKEETLRALRLEDYQKKLDWAELQDWNLISWVAKYVGGTEYEIDINGVRFDVRDFDDFKDEFFKLIAKYRI